MQKTTLPEFQQKYSLKVMDKLRKKPTSEPFWKTPSKEDEQKLTATGSKKIVDLESIYKKLSDNQYTDYIEWGSDVRLVWSNALALYQNEPFRIIIQELSKWFEEIFVKNFPRLPEELWLQKLKKVQKRVQNLKKESPIIKELLPEIIKSDQNSNQQ